MNENIKESFEKTRIAGKIAANALDEVAKNVLGVVIISSPSLNPIAR